MQFSVPLCTHVFWVDKTFIIFETFIIPIFLNNYNLSIFIVPFQILSVNGGGRTTRNLQGEMILKNLEFPRLFLKMKEQHRTSEAFSQKWGKMMEFPILFQKIQSISEHFEFQIWNFQRLYFLQKTVSSTEGVRGKFLKWRPFKSVILTHDPFSRDKQAYKQRRFFAKDAAALNFSCPYPNSHLPFY